MTTKSSEVKIYESYISCQLRHAEESLASKAKQAPQRFVTISRQTGAGGISVGEKLISILKEKDKSARCPWTLFDKNLLDQVLKDHNLPQEFAQYIPEDKISESEDMLEELFGLHPAHWALVRRTSETILHLANRGLVVLVGRGANIVTQKLQLGVHVRLIGSFERRRKHASDYYGLTLKKAEQLIMKEDQGRKNYLKKYFGRNIDDPLLYHLVINTDHVSYEKSAELIANAVL